MEYSYLSVLGRGRGRGWAAWGRSILMEKEVLTPILFCCYITWISLVQNGVLFLMWDANKHAWLFSVVSKVVPCAKHWIINSGQRLMWHLLDRLTSSYIGWFAIAFPSCLYPQQAEYSFYWPHKDGRMCQPGVPDLHQDRTQLMGRTLDCNTGAYHYAPQGAFARF